MGQAVQDAQSAGPAWLRVVNGGAEEFLAIYAYDLGGYRKERAMRVGPDQLYEEALAAHGFLSESDCWFGDPRCEPAIEVFSRTCWGRCEYLVYVHLPGDRCEAPEGIYVSTRPALLRLLGELAPVLWAGRRYHKR